MILLVATTNPGKAREIRMALDGLPVRVLTLRDIPPAPEPEETGRTFAENALAKARHYCERAGVPTVADDSGLAIDALGGRPGVASARYPGETYADKFANLSRELAGHPRPWTARFVCAVALVDRAPHPDPRAAGRAGCEVLFTAQAAVEGEIAPAPRGEQGFGYDPIFFYPPYARTFGEVGANEKMAVSHRGQAFARLRAWLAMRITPA